MLSPHPPLHSPFALSTLLPFLPPLSLHSSSLLFHFNFFFPALQPTVRSSSPPATFYFTYRWNSVLSAACIMATMVFVTEVPILEPMITGTADLTSNTVKWDRKQDIYLKFAKSWWIVFTKNTVNGRMSVFTAKKICIMQIIATHDLPHFTMQHEF